MNDTPSPDLTFEQSLAALERIVNDLEDARLDLDQSLARYEQGVGLIKDCHSRLQQAEQRILLVAGIEEGSPVLQPFKHEATAGKAATPRLRRKPDDSTY